MPRLAGAGRAYSVRMRIDRKVSGTPRRSGLVRRPTLLWIDDFEPGLMLYREMFERQGFEVLTATSGSKGIEIATSNRVDAVITDYEMPEMNGEEVASAVKSLNSRIPVLLFSGSTLVSPHARRVVDAFCDKAGSRDDLLAAIHGLLQKKRGASLQPLSAAIASDHERRTVA